jgi:hypothetical protein
MEIGFRSVQGEKKASIGSGVTNAKGNVTIDIPGEILTTGGDKGIYSFEAVFEGKDKYSRSEAATSMKPMRMEMAFHQEGTEKMVNLKAFELGTDNQWVAVNNLPVVFYVPRTFSLLKVGEGTITDGTASLEFPVTVPGNSLGYLTLLAKVEDNEVYGNVEVSGTINWGKPLPPENLVKRGLGDTNAPLWMVYTLIVLLSLVWFHYMYVIFTVFRIRHLGK